MSKLTTITSPSGAKFTVAAEYAPKFQGLIRDLESQGYGINPKASGGYNPRNIRGTNKPSNHAFGRAIDINWDRNARGTKGDIPAELARSLAAKHGMTWGGDWKNPDAMHFEVANAGPVPMGQRSLTAYAGVQKTQPSTTGTPQPMPNMLNVGGQAPVMDPAEVARRQQLAKALMEAGQQSAQAPRHWTQALGSILQTGMGSYQAGQAAQGLAQGQQSGNSALAQFLMGGDAQAAMTNPYSADSALQYQQQQKIMADRNAAAERLQRIKSEAQNADPMRQLRMEKLRKEIATPSGVGNVPAGYRVKPDGNMEPVPGGPADIKAQQAAAKDAARIESIDAKIGRLEDAATDLKKHPGLNRVVGSVWGNYAPNIPGGEAANFAADLQNLKAQVAGTVIQEMRDASKTGGAVGQITEKEWPLLMNMIASIDEAQSVEQYQERLNQLVDYAKTLRQNLRAAGGSAKPDTSMTTVGPPSAVKEYVYDPATGKVVPK